MKHYEIMTIGMTVDKSEATISSEQIHLAPTPYLKISRSKRSANPRYRALKSVASKSLRKPRKSIFQMMFGKCSGK